MLGGIAVIEGQIVKQLPFTVVGKVAVAACEVPRSENGIVFDVVKNGLADKDFAAGFELALPDCFGVFKSLLWNAKDGLGLTVPFLQLLELSVQVDDAFGAVHERAASAMVRQPFR